MSATSVPTMVVEDVDLRVYPCLLADPLDCEHLWEPHARMAGRAQCAQCGSLARWVNDPRVEEAS